MSFEAYLDIENMIGGVQDSDNHLVAFLKAPPLWYTIHLAQTVTLDECCEVTSHGQISMSCCVFAHNLVLDYSRLDFIMDLLGREPKVCRYVFTISYEFCTHRQIVTLSDLIYDVDHVSISESGFPGSCTLLLALSISRQA